jgi:hypothetical protein
MGFQKSFLFVVVLISQWSNAEVFKLDMTCSGRTVKATLDMDANFNGWEKESVIVDRRTREIGWSLRSPRGSLTIDGQSLSVNFWSDGGIGSKIGLWTVTQNPTSFLDFKDRHFGSYGSFVLIANLKSGVLNVGSLANLFFKDGKIAEIQTGELGPDYICAGRVSP